MDPPPLPPAAPAQPAHKGIEHDPGIRMLMPIGRSAWAIAAGYLGLFSILIIPAPIALLVSIMAVRDIRKSRRSATPRHGMGRVIFGLVLGALGTAVLLFGIVYSLADGL